MTKDPVTKAIGMTSDEAAPKTAYTTSCFGIRRRSFVVGSFVISHFLLYGLAFAQDAAPSRVVIPFDFESKFDDGRYGQMVGDLIWKKLEICHAMRVQGAKSADGYQVLTVRIIDAGMLPMSLQSFAGDCLIKKAIDVAPFVD